MKSSRENYYTTGDTIPAPHPFMITSRHVAMAADRFGGMLTQECLIACEKRGDGCGMRCGISAEEHGQALKVFCLKPMFKKKKKEATVELHKFLLKLKEKYGKKYVGFAFVQKDGVTGADML